MSVDFYPIQPNARPITGAPRCNFANENARALLVAVELSTSTSSELWGMLDAAEVATTLALCELALGNNADAMVRRSGMVRATVVEGQLTINGSSDLRARERLAELREVLRWAVDNNTGIAWC